MTWARRLVGALAASALALVLAPLGPASAAPTANIQPQLAVVRQATAPFHSLAAAERAGYAKFLPCFDLPGVGGMGQHYLLGSALDGTVDAAQPEVLVYTPDSTKLLAVEYVVPKALWTGAEPPELFGQHFHSNDALGVWALHAWIWKPNPLGMNADFNPDVSLCS